MGKLVYFVGILIFIEMMFFIFINAPAMSLNSVVIQSVSDLSGGGIGSNSTGSWSNFKNSMFCNVDETSVNDMASSPSTSCNSTTIWGALMIGLGVAVAIGASLILTSTSASFTDIAWAIVGIFFFIQMGADFIGIYNYLAYIHPPITKLISMVIFVPIAAIFGFIVVEWIRAKD